MSIPLIEAFALNGLSKHFNTSHDGSVVTIKSTYGRLFGFEFLNKNTYDVFLQLFDESGDITVGTTTPIQSYMIPAGDGIIYGRNSKQLNAPISFDNSIKYAVTQEPTGSTAPATSSIIANALYK